ncbi:hypothetical protein [Candidatus Methylacidiphilum infernorum]|nr:hypothetical protein [Candidatus Methylacidiphilum infernorum]
MRTLLPFLFFLFIVALQLLYGLRRGGKHPPQPDRKPFPWEKEQSADDDIPQPESKKEDFSTSFEKNLSVLYVQPEKIPETKELLSAFEPTKFEEKEYSWETSAYDKLKTASQEMESKKLAFFLKNPGGLKRAIVLAEILGPPPSIAPREMKPSWYDL